MNELQKSRKRALKAIRKAIDGIIELHEEMHKFTPNAGDRYRETLNKLRTDESSLLNTIDD